MEVRRNDEKTPELVRFYPPSMSRPWIWIAQRISWLGMFFRLGVARICMPHEDFHRLRKFTKKRTLIAATHVAGYEPFAIFHLSKKLGSVFRYVGSVETFEVSSIRKVFFPKLGVHSLRKRGLDRKSFLCTQSALRSGKHPVVVFPEGVTSDDGSLLPFKRGVVKLAFKSVPEGEDLWIIPLTTVYHRWTAYMRVGYPINLSDYDYGDDEIDEINYLLEANCRILLAETEYALAIRSAERTRSVRPRVRADSNQPEVQDNGAGGAGEDS